MNRNEIIRAFGYYDDGGKFIAVTTLNTRQSQMWTVGPMPLDGSKVVVRLVERLDGTYYTEPSYDTLNKKA